MRIAIKMHPNTGLDTVCFSGISGNLIVFARNFDQQQDEQQQQNCSHSCVLKQPCRFVQAKVLHDFV